MERLKILSILSPFGLDWLWRRREVFDTRERTQQKQQQQPEIRKKENRIEEDGREVGGENWGCWELIGEGLNSQAEANQKLIAAIFQSDDAFQRGCWTERVPATLTPPIHT